MTRSNLSFDNGTHLSFTKRALEPRPNYSANIGSSNNALIPQALNLPLIQPQNFRQHFIRMLSQRRRRTPYAWRRVRVLDRGIDKFHRPAGRMLHLGDHVACARCKGRKVN